jgi:hypothetical protein
LTQELEIRPDSPENASRRNRSRFVSFLVQESKNPPNKTLAFFFSLIIICFAFDHAVSRAMSFIGFQPAHISNIWFIRDQYDYLNGSNLISNITEGWFLIFELFVWVTIAANLVRVLIAIICIDSSSSQLRWEKRNTSAASYTIGWLLAGPGGLIVSSLGIGSLSSAPWTRRLLIYSPKAFMCLVTALFCCGLFLTVEGLLAFTEFLYKKWRER